jgi:hypothetical protein
MSSCDVMCAFCGEGIEDDGVDPCALVVIAKWRVPEAEQQEQQSFTHAGCLRTRMHADAAGVALSLDAHWDGDL